MVYNPRPISYNCKCGAFITGTKTKKNSTFNPEYFTCPICKHASTLGHIQNDLFTLKYNSPRQYTDYCTKNCTRFTACLTKNLTCCDRKRGMEITVTNHAILLGAPTGTLKSKMMYLNWINHLKDHLEHLKIGTKLSLPGWWSEDAYSLADLGYSLNERHPTKKTLLLTQSGVIYAKDSTRQIQPWSVL